MSVDVNSASENQVIKEEPKTSLELSPSLEGHPLEHTWVLWFFKNDRTRDWAENLKRVIEFKTVEMFWSVYNHIQPPSKLAVGCDYSLFKDGIEPKWEDPQNKKGGSWSVNLDRGMRSTRLDQYWLNLLMFCVGELFDEDMDEICGITVNIRGKADRISVWTKDVTHDEAIMRIGHFLKEQLGLTEIINYNSHLDTQNKTGSKAKSLYNI